LKQFLDFTDRARLAQQAGETGFVQLVLDKVRGHGGQGENREIGHDRPETPADAQPAFVGHHDVEKRNVGLEILNQVNCG
jgi:hypothetical protein